MKQKFLAGVTGLLLALAPAVLAQDQIWENWGVFQIPPPAGQPFPPNIDALTFVNHSGALFDVFTSSLYNSYDTVNYTNQGLMIGNPGYDFENIPSGTGTATWSGNWVNQVSGLGTNNGVINCNGNLVFTLTNATFGFVFGFGNLAGSSKCLIYASNIVNSGYVNMSASSLIKMRGKNVNLSRGAIIMQNTSDFFNLFTAGQLDGYWGVGTADFRYFNAPPNNAGSASLLDPGAIFFQGPFGVEALTDVYDITNRLSFPGINQLDLINPLVYTASWVSNNGSNVLTQVAVVLSTNTAFANTVYFNPFEIAVQWQWAATNFPTGSVSTNNYLTLFDDFGEVTNLQTLFHGVAGARTTYMPFNYQFIQTTAPFFLGPPFSAVAPNQVPFIPGTVTNDYSAYGAIFTAGTALPSDVAGGDVTNLAGRIEITADNLLNLTNARLSSLNYMLIQATNHFLGSKGAAIASPNTDIYLRTTNALLSITNLVAPYLNHIDGTCDLWSARWTNVINTVTNSFHVLFVNADFAPVSRPVVETLFLNVTNFSGAQNNLVISDVLNVSRNLKLRADSVTITTNAGNIFAPVGQINILNPNIVWSDATRGVMFLTNNGIITAQNAVYFGGSRTQPPYNTNIVDVPYQAFVNTGNITNQATLVWSTFFLNSGIFDAGEGSFNLQQGCNVILTNGLINSGGEIDLTACSLFVSNHILQAAAALALDVTNSLDDGSLAPGNAFSITNKNFWTAGNGIHLPIHPASASLLGTTITNLAQDYALVVNQWAGIDEGNTPDGFTDNAALGHLILDGNIGCNFEFSPVTGNNALYVDLLDLRDFVATNVDGAGNWLSAFCDPGMTVYYGRALANGVDISEKLATVNNGRFQWVSNYNNGFFSSTNVVYTDGSTNRLNIALVTSCDIDSNNNGIPNCMDPNPIPVLSSASLALAVAYTNQPAPAAVVSWQGFPGTTNTLLSARSSTSTNWTVVTNFVYAGPYPGRVSVTDVIRTNSPKFYRVRAILK